MFKEVSMKDEHKTKEQLINDLVELHQKIAELKAVQAERKKAEEALRESEERYRELVNTFVDGVISINHKMRIILWNPGAEKIFGYTKEEILGHSMMKIVPETKMDAMEKGFAEFQKDGSGPVVGEALEVEGVKKNGTEIPIELSISARKIGEKYIATAVVRDITKRKQMEEQLRKTMEELKIKNQELDDYTYTVSHDLKAPLITIQGFSEMLYKKHKDKMDKKMVEHLKRICQASERLERLISDLLKLSKAGKKIGEFKNENIKPIIEISLSHFESFIKERHIDVKLTPEFPAVHCDISRIMQVFDNLIGNAIKYTGSKKKPEIEIGWSKQKKHYRFWVADNGMGIKEEDKERIFNVFTQGSAITPEEGTGIGLSIAKKVIESHGGKIWVESKPGDGATFYFTIPIKISFTQNG